MNLYEYKKYFYAVKNFFKTLTKKKIIAIINNVFFFLKKNLISLYKNLIIFKNVFINIIRFIYNNYYDLIKSLIKINFFYFKNKIKTFLLININYVLTLISFIILGIYAYNMIVLLISKINLFYFLFKFLFICFFALILTFIDCFLNHLGTMFYYLFNITWCKQFYIFGYYKHVFIKYIKMLGDVYFFDAILFFLKKFFFFLKNFFILLGIFFFIEMYNIFLYIKYLLNYIYTIFFFFLGYYTNMFFLFILLFLFLYFINVKKINILKQNIYLTLTLLFSCLLLLFISFFMNNKFFVDNTYNYFFSFNFKINLIFFKTKIFEIYINEFNLIISLMVLIIFFFSFFYSFYYLNKDENLIKFLFFLTMFAVSMVFLILSNNIIFFFICWELIGISSFFLISHYSKKISNFKSALKALFFNKSSDLIFIIIILLNYKIYGNFNIINNIQKNLQFNIFGVYNINYESLLASLIILVCFIKSAQIFYSTWLVDSMDAPVPASALIHSATLVIAGIILIYKYKILIISCVWVFSNAIMLALLTSAVASIAASYQTDLKKLLAHSTISNCSILICTVLIADTHFFIFFCLLHGFLKSYLFFLCGYIFNNNNHNQDARNFNSKLFKYKPLIWSGYIFICLLSTTPFFINYDIKHYIFNNLQTYNKIYTCFCFVLFYISSVFSVKYGLNYITIFSNLNNFDKSAKYVKNNINNLNNFKSLKVISMFFIFIASYIFVLNFFIFFYYTEFFYLSLNTNQNFIFNIFFFFTLLIFCFFYNSLKQDHKDNSYIYIILILFIISYSF